MATKGRPTKKRKTDLGCKMEELRRESGWSIIDLAEKSGVSQKTLSKLELGQIVPHSPGIITKIADAFNVHPDQLLIPASLTPMLRPQADEPPADSGRKPVTMNMTDDERDHLEKYLQYLRYMSSIERVAQREAAKQSR